ncbi:hypothetical protein [Bradyrhizobium sp. B120]|uniref:hypothetical protein n=1 Tax=Bradyrhizobium sp. B120 TaxID=3410088 RepID=UPI003B97DE92
MQPAGEVVNVGRGDVASSNWRPDRQFGWLIREHLGERPAAEVWTQSKGATDDAQLIELGRQFVEISRLRDAASDETHRLYEIGADHTAAEDAFEDAMDQMRTMFARMITMRPTTIEGMRAIASAVLHFEWDGENVEFTEGCVEGVALGVLVAGLLDKPLPDLPDWAAVWI